MAEARDTSGQAPVPSWVIFKADGRVLEPEFENQMPTRLCRDELDVLVFPTDVGQVLVVPAPGSRIDWITDVTCTLDGSRDPLRRCAPGIYVPGRAFSGPVRAWVPPSGRMLVLSDAPIERAEAAIERLQKWLRLSQS